MGASACANTSLPSARRHSVLFSELPDVATCVQIVLSAGVAGHL